jgi:hypothetical protein
VPTRKQKRRDAKNKRHEYEFVYIDSEGHELEEPPEELVAASRPKARAASSNGKAAVSKKPAPPPRGRREPQPPSWQRAGKRAALLGVVVFVLFSFTARKHGGYAVAASYAVIYTLLFVPFTYMIDRFAYRRYQARKERGGAGPPRPPKKR